MLRLPQLRRCALPRPQRIGNRGFEIAKMLVEPSHLKIAGGFPNGAELGFWLPRYRYCVCHCPCLTTSSRYAKMLAVRLSQLRTYEDELRAVSLCVPRGTSPQGGQIRMLDRPLRKRRTCQISSEARSLCSLLTELAIETPFHDSFRVLVFFAWWIGETCPPDRIIHFSCASPSRSPAKAAMDFIMEVSGAVIEAIGWLVSHALPGDFRLVPVPDRNTNSKHGRGPTRRLLVEHLFLDCGQ
jgi:hypothetical protein